MEQEQISYTVSDFAAVVGVTRQTVHRWINLGHIKVIDFGSFKRIPESEVKRFRGQSQ